LKVNLEKKGYTVSYDTPVIKTGLQTKKVIVDIKTKFIMTKNDNAKEIDNFKIGVNSPIYDLAEVAIEINNQESKFCNFDILGFMATYPAFRIDKFRTGDADTIYTIETDNKDFRFAIRSCALPPGF
jgi:type II restriction/modification system DNA methylase subunit YeeA